MTIKNLCPILAFTFLFASGATLAQSSAARITDNDLTSFKPLNLLTYASFYIPPTRAVDGLGMDINLNAYYTLPKTAQLRGGIAVGIFNGIKLGATYYLKNGEKMANYKFVVSRSTSGNTTITKYYVQQAKVRNFFGPAVDIQAGLLKGAGFYARMDLGFDFQTFGRAYSERDGTVYSGKRNGWGGVKAQVIIANVMFDARFPETDKRAMMFGFQIAPQVASKPWKRVCLYGAMPIGFMKAAGFKDDAVMPILSIDLGMNIRLSK